MAGPIPAIFLPERQGDGGEVHGTGYKEGEKKERTEMSWCLVAINSRHVRILEIP